MDKAEAVPGLMHWVQRRTNVIIVLETLRLRFCSHPIVPFTVKRMGLERDRSISLSVIYTWVEYFPVSSSAYTRSPVRAVVALINPTTTGPPPRVHANADKESLLDRVPLSGPWQQMAYWNPQAAFRCPTCRFHFPHSPTAVAIAPPRRLRRSIVPALAHVLPRTSQTLHDNTCRIVVLTDFDPSQMTTDIKIP